jgi:hypothetical protein
MSVIEFIINFLWKNHVALLLKGLGEELSREQILMICACNTYKRFAFYSIGIFCEMASVFVRWLAELLVFPFVPKIGAGFIREVQA